VLAVIAAAVRGTRSCRDRLFRITQTNGGAGGAILPTATSRALATDEIRTDGSAVQVFRTKMLDAERLRSGAGTGEGEQRRRRRKSQARRMADEFEARCERVVQEVSASATHMPGFGASMSATAAADTRRNPRPFGRGGGAAPKTASTTCRPWPVL